MIQIDARSVFWTIKHHTCGATFQITGDKILENDQTIRCSNCAIPVNLGYLKDAVIQLMNCQQNLERASQRHNDHENITWQINPPIIVEEEESISPIIKLI